MPISILQLPYFIQKNLSQFRRLVTTNDYRKQKPRTQILVSLSGFNKFITLLFSNTLLIVNSLLIFLKRAPFLIIHLPFKALHLLVKYIFIRFNPRKRGRPRTKSLLVIWRKKLNDYFDSKIPHSARIFLAILVIIGGLGIYTLVMLKAAYELPNPTKLTQYEKPLTTEFYDRNGKLLYRLYEGRNRTLINLKDIPPYLVQATIAVEDKNFYHHLGIDPIAIIRATQHNFTDDTLQGASTITQQLIKNTILNSERTYARKIKEVILSFWTEILYSKEDILKMYFNEAPYGGPFWGIEAAAQGYFGKSVKELTLAEAAFLAGLPASPTQYSPYGTKSYLGKVRQQEVLRRMREDGYITKEQEEITVNEQLVINPPFANIKAPHFVMYVKDQLSQKYGPRVVSQGGLKIYTTLDYSLQEKVEQIVLSEIDDLASLNVQNGAAMVTDATNGQILAMIGSKDYDDPDIGNYNATITLRQPGSSIKPITYASAFQEGLSPGNTILDTPTTFRDNWGNTYSPVNYDGNFHGAVSVRTALGSSYNIPAVRVMEKIGLNKMIQTAKNLGITSFNQPERYGLSLTLGAGEVRMIDMMTVYGTFSQNGIKRIPSTILKVSDSEGNILEEYEDNPKPVLKPEIAYLITSILTDNKARIPAFGSNSMLNIPGFEVAVKTGTTDNKRDNWTFGYTPQYVVGVWVGNNDNSAMNPKLASGITGAAPIWNKITHLLVDGHIPVAFSRPNGVINVSVDGRKDLAVSDFVQKQQGIRDDAKNGKIKFDSKSFNIFSATYSAISSSKDIKSN